MKSKDLTGFEVVQILKKAETKKEKGTWKQRFLNVNMMLKEIASRKLFNFRSLAGGTNAMKVHPKKSLQAP
jgi:hypothetical protein